MDRNSDLYLKARDAGELKYWTEVVRKTTKLEAELGLISCPRLAGLFKRMKMLEEKQAEKGNYWGFLTFRGNENITFEKLEKLVNRITQWKWLKNNAMWAYEQTGETEEEMGSGVHCHILFKLHGCMHGGKQKGYMACKKDIVKHCKEEYQDWMEDQGIHIESAPKEDYKKMENYIIGQKSEKKKHKAQEFNEIWREKNNIKKSYGLISLCETQECT